jgi:hypothetical protein
MTDLNFNAEEYEPLGSFEPIPIGEYKVVITASEMKTASTGENNKYLQLTYEVVEGEYEHRLLFDRLNLVNENAKAQEIAQRALSAICHAVGVLHPKASEELHDKPFLVKVGIRPAKGEYAASNQVKGYSSIGGKTPEDKKATAAPAAGAAAKPKRPWEKK